MCFRSLSKKVDVLTPPQYNPCVQLTDPDPPSGESKGDDRAERAIRLSAIDRRTLGHKVRYPSIERRVIEIRRNNA